MPRLPVVHETGRDEDAALRELNLAHAVLHQREQQAGIELQDVVGDAREHIGARSPRRAPPSSTTSSPTRSAT